MHRIISLWRNAFTVCISVMLLAPADALAQTSPSPFTVGYRHDAGRRVVGTIAPDPDGAGALKHAATRNTYDPAGRLIWVETGELAVWQSEHVLPSAWSGFSIFKKTEIGYDALNRKVVERVYDVPANPNVPVAVTQYSYDLFGRQICSAIRMNPAAFGSLPGSACSLGTTGSAGPDRITRNVYDAAGQLLKVQKAYGTPLQQDYATYEYTPNGKQKAVIDANGNRAEMDWDGHDRQATWRFPDKTSIGVASASDYEAYTYDANGNRLTLRKRDGRTISYTYDALNRVVSKLIPDGCAPIGGGCAPAAATRDVHYAYDLRGLQTAARFDSAGGADAVLSTWDGFGRQTRTTTSMGGTTRVLDFGFDANGNRTSIAWADGATFNHDYDGLDRLSFVREGASYQVYGTSYNAQGLLSGSGLRAGTSTDATGYGFDGIGRLTSRTTAFAIGFGPYVNFTYGYNAASQLASRDRSNDLYAFGGYVNLNRGYQRNGLNQYTQAGSLALQYDPNGNLTTDSLSTYGYDVENRLVSGPGTTLTWDPLGRLYQVAGPSGTTRFLYDGDQLAGEYDASGTLLRRYLHGTGEDDPLLWYEGAGLASRRALHADHQGSIIAVSDGTTVTPYAYDEYGIPASGQTARFQYTGQAWLPELGLYHYKARIYSPTLGRFLQTDPIGYDDQLNLYAYVGNDPVNMRDPTGMDGACIYAGGCTPKGPTIGSVLWDTIKNDPGILIDAAIVVGDVLLGGPTGEAAAGIALRRGATEGAEAASRASTLRPGPNARESIPAQSGRPTSAQQREINRIGGRSGCHTCGSRDSGRRSGNWTGDHQPPNGRNSAGQPQRFYPHCSNCNLTTDSLSTYGYDVENRLISGPGTTLTWDPLGRLY